jgi:DnaJ-class molecular chaperone
LSNTLNRDIKKGEIVVMQGAQPLYHRAFVCETGFGMNDKTTGGSIGGYWLNGTGRDAVRGEQIDPRATMKFKREDTMNSFPRPVPCATCGGSGSARGETRPSGVGSRQMTEVIDCKACNGKGMIAPETPDA